MLKRLIEFIIFIFLFSFTKEGNLLIYDSRNFYCNGRIYSDNNGLSINEINSICSKITNDDRYVVLFTNMDRFSDERSYTYNSEDFFSTRCYSNSINCKYDFAICIYLWGGKVIITSGSVAKNIVNTSKRMNIINDMIIYLRNQEYYQAIQSAITQISKIYYQNGGGRYGNDTSHQQGGHSTFVVFFFILILCCCCICCYFIYQNQQKSNTYTQIIENQNNGSYTVSQNTYDQSLKIHNHLVSLEKIIEEIKQSDPPIKNTNICLICMQPIINTVGTLESANTRFACQHVYHRDCLSRYNINCCLMCRGINDNNSTIIINNYDSQVLNEEQVKNFIKNLQNIYPPQELKIYAQRYPQEYNNFNDGLMLGLLASSWAMPPVVVVNNNPGYNPYGYNEYGGYNNYNQQNMYGGDPNPDSAVGGFQPNNIEMTEFNNQNNNNGGNFGGGNNNDYTSGNFGGGNNNDYTSGNFGGFGNNETNVGDFGGDGFDD